MNAPQGIRPPDKARVLIALVVAKNLPNDHSPLSYVLKLRDAFPIKRTGRGGAAQAGDRLVERIVELEKRLALARADEAHAKLELLTYQAKHPPCEHETPNGKRPGSPSCSSSGTKRPVKKTKKQQAGDRIWFDERSAQLDAAVRVVQKAFDPHTYLKNTGLVASLLRLRGTPASIVQPTALPLLQRCLADASTHIRHICAHPSAQTSLHSLNAIQTLLPELLLSIQTRATLSDTDDDVIPELSRLVVHDMVDPIIHGIHPASTALVSHAASATRSRTRRGKLKPGARAAREAEENFDDQALVDIRPGLLNILCLVAKTARNGDLAYAVLPVVCDLVRGLVAPAPGSASGRAMHVERLAAADSLWYLSSACHVVLEHASPFKPHDAELLSRCSDRLGAVLTSAEVCMAEPVREMLCAVFERITLRFPS